jgi:hypothetical protein
LSPTYGRCHGTLGGTVREVPLRTTAYEHFAAGASSSRARAARLMHDEGSDWMIFRYSAVGESCVPAAGVGASAGRGV